MTKPRQHIGVKASDFISTEIVELTAFHFGAMAQFVIA
jgi:hypothetical protein